MVKGIELPVNVLVIIVIAVLVLIALATLVAMGINILEPVQIMWEKTAACGTYQCGAVPWESVEIGINVDDDPNDVDNLGELCVKEKQCVEGAITDLDVKKYCGCPGI